jgi:ribonuclease P protein subunit RPR2
MRGKPISQIKIARERIKILGELAIKRAKEGDIELANRYIYLARKIGMRYNVRLPKDLKRRYCKYCYKFLLPGKTSQHRMKHGILTVKCLNCNGIMRYPVKNKK